jgi:hypothetical protein
MSIINFDNIDINLNLLNVTALADLDCKMEAADAPKKDRAKVAEAMVQAMRSGSFSVREIHTLKNATKDFGDYTLSFFAGKSIRLGMQDEMAERDGLRRDWYWDCSFAPLTRGQEGLFLGTMIVSEGDWTLTAKIGKGRVQMEDGSWVRRVTFDSASRAILNLLALRKRSGKDGDKTFAMANTPSNLWYTKIAQGFDVMFPGVTGEDEGKLSGKVDVVPEEVPRRRMLTFHCELSAQRAFPGVKFPDREVVQQASDVAKTVGSWGEEEDGMLATKG